jgi:hypothetical protein
LSIQISIGSPTTVIARADATFAHNKLSHHPRGQTAVGYVEIDEPAWSVARLNDEIAAILESAADRFPTYVVGEVSDATAKGYGTFFTLRDVEATYVNCWRNYTQVRTQYQILNDIGATIDIHRQSAPHDELIERHQQYENP